MLRLACDQPHTYLWEYLWSPTEPLSPHNSKHLFDFYTFTHVFWLLLGTVVAKRVFSTQNLKFIVILLVVVSILFEVVENQKSSIMKYRRIEIDSRGKTSYRGDSVLNILGDIVGNVIGVWLGLMLPFQSSIYALITLFSIITMTIGRDYWLEFLKFFL